MLGLPPVVVHAGGTVGPCALCGASTYVEKTLRRRVVTLAHGVLIATEATRVCRRRCRHPNGTLVRVRSDVVAGLVPPAGTFGYDVIVRVGLQRYLEHRQREEIQEDLRHLGVTVSTGEITVLARRFLDCLRALHEARAPALAEALLADGGWPLHVDATGENGRGTLLVLMAGWRGWVLDSRRIPTERADQILPCLRDVAARFTNPCAVMRDLGRAMIPAVEQFVAERKLRIPVLSCHQHFLADIGEDLLAESHDELRRIFRTCNVRALLRTLARDLGRELGAAIHETRAEVRAWQEQTAAAHEVPAGRAGLGVIRSLAQWVLDYQADSRYHTFPFDRPWLDLYDRCKVMSRAVDAYLRRTPSDRKVGRLLRRLARVLGRVISREDAVRAVRTLRRRSELFDELRSVLRIQPRCAEHRVRPRGVLTPDEAMAELRDIRSGLTRWKRSLRKRRPSRGPAENEREAIDLVLAHLARHGKSLFGHVIHLPHSTGVRLVERTNQLAENFFRDLKHGERRRSGRKTLTQDLENLPPDAALVPNLRHEDYVMILCGSLDDLPRAFADLDAVRRADAASQGAPRVVKAALPVLESASLPTSDRRGVRSDDMNRRVHTAASSRAPRRVKISC